MKLNKSQIKALPEPVSKRVLALQTKNRTRYCAFEVILPTRGIYLDEDADYDFFNLRGEKYSVQMDGEWSGYTRHPVASAVAKTAPLPEGCFCVEFQYFLGHPIIHVYESKNLLGG